MAFDPALGDGSFLGVLSGDPDGVTAGLFLCRPIFGDTGSDPAARPWSASPRNPRNDDFLGLLFCFSSMSEDDNVGALILGRGTASAKNET
jgi:hypothetical protein